MGSVGANAEDLLQFELGLGDTLRHLRAVLIARHGVHVGADVHAEVAAFAWEHRQRLATYDNPIGYLFRVSQSRARRYRRWGRTVVLPAELTRFDATSDGRDAATTASADVDLGVALARLSADERTVAVIVHAYGYSYEAAADLLGTTTTVVRNRLHRGMAKLRRLMHEESTP